MLSDPSIPSVAPGPHAPTEQALVASCRRPSRGTPPRATSWSRSGRTQPLPAGQAGPSAPATHDRPDDPPPRPRGQQCGPSAAWPDPGHVMAFRSPAELAGLRRLASDVVTAPVPEELGSGRTSPGGARSPHESRPRGDAVADALGRELCSIVPPSSCSRATSTRVRPRRALRGGRGPSRCRRSPCRRTGPRCGSPAAGRGRPCASPRSTRRTRTSNRQPRGVRPQVRGAARALRAAGPRLRRDRPVGQLQRRHRPHAGRGGRALAWIEDHLRDTVPAKADDALRDLRGGRSSAPSRSWPS